MIMRILLAVALVVMATGCDSPSKKKPHKPKKPPGTDMADQSGDQSFESFLGRLNKAAAARDMQTMASMMTANFGFRLDPPGEGDGVFQFWDQNNMWPAVQAILSQRFVPKGRFMVAPAQFANDNTDYRGYRAGIVQINGSWKFAYFVTD